MIRPQRADEILSPASGRAGPLEPKAVYMNPYPDWLNPGDNAWQMVAATLVGLMSIPGIAVLYGGLVQKKWAVNTMLMAFTGFSLVLVVWVLWGFKMGFGDPMKLGPGILQAAVGKPRSILGTDNQHQAVIPLLDGLMPKFRFSETSLAYFQFVFAAITPLLVLGSVVGRINFNGWLLFVPLWSTFAYSVNAFLLWGGGWWASAHPSLGSWFSTGALDFSGGYVIHLATGPTAVPPPPPAPTRRWPSSTPTCAPRWRC